METGSNTFASWKSPVAATGAGDRSRAERDAYFGEGEEKEQAEERRKRRRRRELEQQLELNDDDEDDDDYGMQQQGSYSSKNPFVEWLRKIYDAIFFYGLDVPTPSSKRRRPQEAPLYIDEDDQEDVRFMPPRRNNIKSGKQKKSPFFTQSEQLSQKLIASSSPSESEYSSSGDDFIRSSRRSSSSNGRSSSSSSSSSSIGSSSSSSSSGSGSGSSRSRSKAPLTPATPEEQETTLKRRLQLLDKVLSDLSSMLQDIDEDIKQLENYLSLSPVPTGKEATSDAPIQLKKLYEEREALRKKIEIAQVEFVNTSAEKAL